MISAICRPLKWEYLDGIGKAEAVLLVRSHRGPRSIFNDAVFNLPHGKGLGRFIFDTLNASTGGRRVTRLFRCSR